MWGAHPSFLHLRRALQAAVPRYRSYLSNHRLKLVLGTHLSSLWLPRRSLRSAVQGFRSYRSNLRFKLVVEAHPFCLLHRRKVLQRPMLGFRSYRSGHRFKAQLGVHPLLWFHRKVLLLHFRKVLSYRNNLRFEQLVQVHLSSHQQQA